jgi:hypothetical protein
LDFTFDGIRFHTARVLGRVYDQPWGTVQISNGDVTYTAHNRYGSWMIAIGDVLDYNGAFKEPAALDWGSQVEVCSALNRRFDAELKSRGIKTAAEMRAEQEEIDREQRRKQDAIDKAKQTRAKNKAKKEDTDA